MIYIIDPNKDDREEKNNTDVLYVRMYSSVYIDIV